MNRGRELMLLMLAGGKVTMEQEAVLYWYCGKDLTTRRNKVMVGLQGIQKDFEFYSEFDWQPK